MLGIHKDKATCEDTCPVLQEITHMALLPNVYEFIMKGCFLSSEEKASTAKVRKNERIPNRNGNIYAGFEEWFYESSQRWQLF